MSKPLLLTSSEAGERFCAKGSWTAVNAAQLEQNLQDLLVQSLNKSTIQIDMSEIRGFDTFGAWLLERFRRDLIHAGVKAKIVGLRDKSKPLLAEVAELDQSHAIEPVRPSTTVPWYSAMPNMLVGYLRDLADFLAMFGAVIVALTRVVLHPRKFRLTALVHQFDMVSWKALPIVLLVTFIIGAIIAQQAFFHFRRFGADYYVIDMMGFLIMREIGVLLVAIMVAGRSGSSYTAELGSMRMREEIDALKTMGFDPVEVLVLPRVLVLIIALPVLTFIGSLAALFGAGLVATFYAGMSPELFLDRLNDAISINHFKVGMIKAPFIGAVIGIIACTEGLQVKGSALSLGVHTTRSVVKSIFMVIVFDGLFAIFFTSIGI